MAKSIKLTKRVTGEIEKSVYFIAENIIHFEQFEHSGKPYTSIICVGATENKQQTFRVIESPEFIDALINGK